ncbi:MAG TPA: YfhO family protein, partial [Candidatus Acidoferrales bacterium]|nr:YfhO family protein [Candidatus Acidoferrales bacterium]
QIGKWFSLPLQPKSSVARAPAMVFENPRALPRSFFVAAERVRTSIGDCVAAVNGSNFEPALDLLVDKQVGSVAPGPPSPLASAVEVLSYRPSEVNLRASSDRAGYVVLSDAFFPGWDADVDGKAAEILRADCFFRAVRVDAGNHAVRFHYRPASFRIGRAISLASLAVVVFVGGWRFRQRRTSTSN